MRHQDLTLNHRLESWVYANAAARTGATGFVAGDVGRISYQSDTGDYWRLTATTPTWAKLHVVPIGGTAAQVLSKNSATDYDASWATLSGATFHGSGGTPTGTSVGGSGVMMGMGALLKMTPVRTGKVILIIQGSLMSSVAAGISQAVMYYGTGAAPANGGAITGASVSTTLTGHSAAANYQLPFTAVGLAGSLALGTQIWFDIRLNTGGSGTSSIIGPFGTAIELP
jgi:hypothetical protein